MPRSEPARRTLGEAGIKRVLAGLASRIHEEHGDARSLAFIGVRTRGPVLARRVARILEERRRLAVPVGELDVTLYRDDLDTLLPGGPIDATKIPFDVTDRTLVLFDDVLHTGRTVRAALDHIVALGRPRAVFLAVLMDRGGRELPIEAHFVGKKIELPEGRDVRVKLVETDRVDEVVVA